MDIITFSILKACSKSVQCGSFETSARNQKSELTHIFRGATTTAIIGNTHSLSQGDSAKICFFFFSIRLFPSLFECSSSHFGNLLSIFFANVYFSSLTFSYVFSSRWRTHQDWCFRLPSSNLMPFSMWARRYFYVHTSADESCCYREPRKMRSKFIWYQMNFFPLIS